MLKKFAFNILGIILYRILLDYNYIYIISPLYNYSGFSNQSSSQSTIISYIALLAIIPFVLHMYKLPKVSANIVALLFLISFVPMTSLMRFIPIEPRFFALYLTYWGLLLLFYNIIPQISFSNLESKRSENIIWIFLIIFVGTIIYISGRYLRFRLHFSLGDVYDLREEERSLNLPSFLLYLLPAAGSILPVILVYFLYRKKRIIALVIGFILLLDFSIGGNKSIIFYTILGFLGYFLFNYNRITLYSWVLAFISFLSLVENKLLSTYSIAEIGIRRVLFVPGHLNYNYYDYFSKNEPDYFRQGILRWFGLSSPYKDHIQHIIGREYYGNLVLNANNGLFSDAYLNLRNLGIFLFPFFLIIIFKLFDTCSKELDSRLLIVPIIVSADLFNGGCLSSILMTNGILLLLVILYFMPRLNRT